MNDSVGGRGFSRVALTRQNSGSSPGEPSLYRFDSPSSKTPETRLPRNCKTLPLPRLLSTRWISGSCSYKHLRAPSHSGIWYSPCPYPVTHSSAPTAGGGRTVSMPDKLRKQFGGTVYAIVFIIPWWLGTVWILKTLGKLIFQ